MPTSPDFTVTGTLQAVSGSDTAGSVVFTLVNFGNFPPLVSGTSLLDPLSVTAVANGSGVFSQVLYGNDQVSPANTYYQVDVFNPAGALVWTASYQFNGSGTFDLGAISPITSTTGGIAVVSASVGMSGDGTVFNVTVPGSPVTTVGTLAPTLAAHSPNAVLAGPTSGSPAAPTFRALIGADLPVLVGDTGLGGTQGAAPAPGAGDSAAGKFLKADATWAVPPGAGGASYKVVSKTANYTAANGDDVWCTSGTFTVTLPAASTTTRVKVTNRGTGAITVSPASGTIIGNASMVLGTQYSSVELSSDGTNWTVE